MDLFHFNHMNYKIQEYHNHSSLKNKIIFVKGYTINSAMPATIYDRQSIQFYNAFCGQKKLMKGRMVCTIYGVGKVSTKYSQIVLSVDPEN